jgi:ADP-heptose:LPS heptosyltransferase
MSLLKPILDAVARPLLLRRRVKVRAQATDPRILIIRRNRMGDMLLTVPLFHALRRHFPAAHIAVACDAAGAPIAQACPAVDDVMLLHSGWNPWQAVLRNAAGLQDYDWVLAAKGGFDRRLAILTRLTNAPLRIGFERAGHHGSIFFTHPVLLPDEAKGEHQVETQMRLLRPLGLVRAPEYSVDLSLELPEAARQFATDTLARFPFLGAPGYILVNISSTVRQKFREEDYIALSKRLLGATNLAVGLVAAPLEQQKANEIALCMASRRIAAVETPGALDLAALLERAHFLVTPEGGAAHLAAAVGTPALVLWSEGPFQKWRSRGKRHAYVRAEPHESLIPLERVWQEIAPFLPRKVEETAETMWADPPPPDPGVVS